MNKYLIFLIAGICLVVLVFGHFHWKNMSQIASVEGRVASETILNKEKEKKEALINRLKPKHDQSQSLIEFLQYRALTQEKVTISVIGSDGTAGTSASIPSKAWPELLKKTLKLRHEGLESLSLMNYGYKGYSTTDLLKGKKIDLVIKDQPDVIIFENAMINNHYQSISIKQTEKDLKNIISKMKKQLPNTKIVIMSSNPIVNSKNENNLGLRYIDYIKESEKIIKKNHWAYIDIRNGIEKKLKEENILLVDILENNYPNDQGNVLWFEVLYEYIKKS